MGKVLFGDTDTIVGYFDQDPFVHVIKRELDASVGDTVFDGVVDEVDQHLTNFFPIGFYPEILVGTFFKFERNVAFGGLDFQFFKYLFA